MICIRSVTRTAYLSISRWSKKDEGEGVRMREKGGRRGQTSREKVEEKGSDFDITTI